MIISLKKNSENNSLINIFVNKTNPNIFHYNDIRLLNKNNIFNDNITFLDKYDKKYSKFNTFFDKNGGNNFNLSNELNISDTMGKTLGKSIYNSFYDAFCSDMLCQINFVRTNPKIYTEKILKFMKYINTNKRNNKKFFLVNNKTKINLLKGEEAFYDCMNFIEDLDLKIREKQIILRELVLKEELKFPFPVENPENSINKDYIKENLIILKNKIGEKFKIKGFHYDLSTNDPEISTVLQIVDDNNSGKKRRNMLLDENVKYIGINIGKLKENLYCIYLVMAV